MITGATPGAARRALRDALQRAMSCVTPAVIIDRVDSVESALIVTAELADPASRDRVVVSMRHLYTLVSDASRDRRHRWQARTTAYFYKLDDGAGREILAYHWHPAGRSPETRPHLHLGAGAGTLRGQLQKAHLGTGFVTPVLLLTLLLESFAVRPRRADWTAVLDAAGAALSLT